jgi:predicted negative regulator of RcsB-dependent stress response
MARKAKKPSPRPGAPHATEDDAFTARVLELALWARRRVEVLVAAGVAVVLLAVGGIYYLNQRSERLERAAMELEVIQQTAGFVPPEELAQQLDEFLARFSGTPYGVEARLVYAELHLAEGRPQAAVEVLRPVAPAYRSPLGIQATFLLAVAHEEAEEWDEAARVYGELETRAEFLFQRQDAAEGLARALLAQGDSAGAIQVYRRLVEGTDEEDGSRGYFEMRLAELTRGGS